MYNVWLFFMVEVTDDLNKINETLDTSEWSVFNLLGWNTVLLNDIIRKGIGWKKTITEELYGYKYKEVSEVVRQDNDETLLHIQCFEKRSRGKDKYRLCTDGYWKILHSKSIKELEKYEARDKIGINLLVDYLKLLGYVCTVEYDLVQYDMDFCADYLYNKYCFIRTVSLKSTLEDMFDDRMTVLDGVGEKLDGVYGVSVSDDILVGSGRSVRHEIVVKQKRR